MKEFFAASTQVDEMCPPGQQVGGHACSDSFFCGSWSVRYTACSACLFLNLSPLSALGPTSCTAR
jgi:hypothetical protein